MLVSKTAKTYGNSTFTFYKMTFNGKSCGITIVEGEINKVNITYKNAMQKAFRGMGKDFADLDTAISNYKDASIIAMINHVKELNNYFTKTI